ncbi:hypothetical protein V9T40_002586 [Parthenolecanium corni]|uniref:Cytochrome P450 n=1 Tax=Parthenolecanium corni TaxID=536013 RepID=A0AAN9Y5R4_9HEMI
MLTSAFHTSILNSFSDTINENCKILMEKLENELDSEEFNIYPYLTNCALDIICQTAMGVSVNAQHGTSEYMKAVKEISRTMLRREMNPWWWYDSVHYFSSNYADQQKALKIVHGFTDSVIERRKLERVNKISYSKNETAAYGEKQKKAFLDLLLDMAEESSKPFTTADIREEVDTFMFAGHDSSSSATAYAVFLLGCHPEIQEKVFQELYSVFGSSDRFPTKADISQLTYLECVTRESLRLYPVVPVIGRILAEDTELDGYLVPAGTTIDINISAIHHNANHFPEPNKFNPDNFSPENKAKRHPFAFVPFAAGLRNCIGRKFASDEEMILLSTLFRKYKVVSLQKPEELMVEPDLVMRPKNGIKVRISRRQYPSD